MKFNQFGLDARLYDGIKHAGFAEATPIQEQAIPIALSGQDLIATAQTGTGKTAAFVLPILHKLINGKMRQSRVLIITPTRELAEQIHQTIKQLRPSKKIRSVSVYGGVGASSQIDMLRSGCEIIVACPGRLLDHINNKHAKLDNIDFLVLDEADRMFDMGFLPDIKRIIKHLPTNRQTMLFSATFPEEIETLAKKTLRNPRRIAIGISKPAHTVSHTLYPVPQHLKKNLLIRILKQTDTDSVLIFARTKHRTKRLAQQISKKGYQVTSLHGDRSQNQRQSALNGFKKGHYQIMVATDIAARGLDISSISHVINYDMPDTPDAYIHRIGRTGRAEQTGDAFTLCTPDDMEMVSKIERIMKQKLSREKVDAFDYDEPTPQFHNKATNSRVQTRQRSH